MAKLFFLIAFFALIGCAPLAVTLREIGENPDQFIAEANDTQKTIDLAFPEGAKVPGYIALGYAIKFLRQIYVNKQKLKTEGKT